MPQELSVKIDIYIGSCQCGGWLMACVRECVLYLKIGPLAVVSILCGTYIEFIKLCHKSKFNHPTPCMRLCTCVPCMRRGVCDYRHKSIKIKAVLMSLLTRKNLFGTSTVDTPKIVAATSGAAKILSPGMPTNIHH